MSRLFVFVIVFALTAVGCGGSSLTSNLSNTNSVARVQFDERVRAEFPIGTSEEEMLRSLRWQGFKRDVADFGGDRRHVPYMSRPTMIPCGASYSVFWEAEDGRLTDVRGIYDVTCF